MNRSRGGMRGFGGSIKSRLGALPSNFPRTLQTKRVTMQRRLGGGIATGVKARLGLGVGSGGGVKKRSVAALAIGEILDARQKINFNRVKTGRIGDARDKIEEKRRQKVVRGLRTLEGETGHGRFHQNQMGYQGLFRSAVSGIEDAYRTPVQEPRVTRSTAYTCGPGVLRVAPPPTYEDDLPLTRTIRNPSASYSMMRSDYESGGGGGRGMVVGRGVASRGYEQRMELDEEDYFPQRDESQQCRILVSNLQPSVTADDIVELFSDIGELSAARMAAPGQAEVTYMNREDAVKAIEAYHNRLLDGSAMRVFLNSFDPPPPPQRPPPNPTNVYSGMKPRLISASGASMKLPAVKPTGIKIQPDISAIHKVLFNPGGSATRGLFKR